MFRPNFQHLVADVDCGLQTLRDSRIINGIETVVGEIPWIVSIKYPRRFAKLANGQHQCGGSLIAKDWILTAAHCVNK